MKSIEGYLRLPRTIVRSVRSDDGEYIVLEVAELPGFVVAARTPDELEAEFWVALTAFLQSYLDDGDEPPIPADGEEMFLFWSNGKHEARSAETIGAGAA